MGWFIECTIVNIDLDNTEGQINHYKAEIEVIIFGDKTYFSWQSNNKDMDARHFTKLAEGLYVSTYRAPDQQIPPYPANVHIKDDDSYSFETTYIPNGGFNFFHIVLPEYCYLTKDEIDILKDKNATIYTHTKRQAITIVPDSEYNQTISVTFKGSNEKEFNKEKMHPQPIIYNVPYNGKTIFASVLKD